MKIGPIALFKQIPRVPVELRQVPDVQITQSRSAVSVEAILISCAGLGMGNASRVIAVVEELTACARREGRALSFHIVSWGAGYTFLNEYKKSGGVRFELTQSSAYSAKWTGTFLDYILSFIKNVSLLRGIVRRSRPKLIILDSDYHFPAYFATGCPIVFIGQAEDVVDRSRGEAYRPSSWRETLNFNLKERMDSYVQKLFSDEVLVPCFTGAGRIKGNVRRIPLIVRKEFLQPARPRSAGEAVGVLLSGSEIEKNVFTSLAAKYGVEVLAPNPSGGQPTVPSHAEMLDRFDLIFTQGGLSSISECIARGKFVVVFPMREHPEQALNALEVQQLGWGALSRVEELEHYPALIERVRSRQRLAKPAVIACNGAEVAAAAVFARITRVMTAASV